MSEVSDRIKFLRVIKLLLPDNPICVELGVYKGEFSKMILDELHPSDLILIDPFETNDNDRYSGGQPTAYSSNDDLLSTANLFVNNRIVRIIKQYSFDAVNFIEDNSFDFVYIDSDHRYESVKRDLNDWLPKLKKGGLMCGHDYIENKDFGVICAVDEFCQQHNFELIIFNTNGGDWALKEK